MHLFFLALFSLGLFYPAALRTGPRPLFLLQQDGRTLSLSPHPFIPARRRAEVRARLRECDRSLSDKGSDASRMSGACVRRAPRRAAPELHIIKVFI